MHTKGGWMYYEYLGPGSAPNTNKYRITLKFYTACMLNTGQFDPTINFAVFDAGTHQQLFTIPVTYTTSDNIQNCPTEDCHPCISLPPSICYKITTYQTEQDLPRIANGYTFAYQRCCRIGGIINLQDPSSDVGETWMVTIPGTAIAGAEFNTSAMFAQNDTAIICQNSYFTFDFSATDIDNDSLVYNFSAAYGGLSTSDPIGATTAPPYSSVPYQSPFSGFLPLGSGVTINHQTGIVSGIAPGAGIYVVTVTVSEYRRGTNIKIAEVRKSLHIQVADCSSTKPILDPVYYSCNGYTKTFVNMGDQTHVSTYDWDFGDGNTSNAPSPVTHTYADTGIYILKLTVNRNLPCSDSANSKVFVYPGFFPAFSVGGQCANTPIQFTDNTITNYGVVTPWSWDFGDISSPSNASTLQNPTHNYATAGSYQVELTVGNSKGCVDTVSRNIVVLDKPPLSVTNDTLICNVDTLQLNAVGTGSFLWSPNYMISNTNINDPLVSPDITTTYTVKLTDPFGCVATASVKVNVVDSVTLNPFHDSTICQSDNVVLRIVSNGLHYLWTPGASLNDSIIKNPTATPPTTTIYHVLVNIGKCIATADITLKTVPYPAANAGPDQVICFGRSVQLQASGGSIYNWNPIVFLNAANIPNPVSILPTSNVRYIVTVRDTLGCPKAVRDTMLLTVVRINANAGPRDTSVVVGQPLQLGASGGTNYLWSPSTWLDDPNISNPIALPLDDIQYVVRVSNNIGCFNNDTILVRVYKLNADLLVPSAFTPNGDGHNDTFHPFLIGMKSLDLFQVYNRWGQMLFSGTDPNNGWDGTFGGKPQESATYVWYAVGTDYKNTVIKKKGYVVLIR